MFADVAESEYQIQCIAQAVFRSVTKSQPAPDEPPLETLLTGEIRLNDIGVALCHLYKVDWGNDWATVLPPIQAAATQCTMTSLSLEFTSMEPGCSMFVADIVEQAPQLTKVNLVGSRFAEDDVMNVLNAANTNDSVKTVIVPNVVYKTVQLRARNAGLTKIFSDCPDIDFAALKRNANAQKERNARQTDGPRDTDVDGAENVDHHPSEMRREIRTTDTIERPRDPREQRDPRESRDPRDHREERRGRERDAYARRRQDPVWAAEVFEAFGLALMDVANSPATVEDFIQQEFWHNRRKHEVRDLERAYQTLRRLPRVELQRLTNYKSIPHHASKRARDTRGGGGKSDIIDVDDKLPTTLDEATEVLKKYRFTLPCAINDPKTIEDFIERQIGRNEDVEDIQVALAIVNDKCGGKRRRGHRMENEANRVRFDDSARAQQSKRSPEWAKNVMRTFQIPPEDVLRTPDKIARFVGALRDSNRMQQAQEVEEASMILSEAGEQVHESNSAARENAIPGSVPRNAPAPAPAPAPHAASGDAAQKQRMLQWSHRMVRQTLELPADFDLSDSAAVDVLRSELESMDLTSKLQTTAVFALELLNHSQGYNEQQVEQFNRLAQA